MDAGGGAGREVCSSRDGRDSWAWQIMKHKNSRSTHTAWTGSQRASHFSLESTTSVYVAMLILVTKASMYLCRDQRRCADQSGGIYNSDSTVARDFNMAT